MKLYIDTTDAEKIKLKLNNKTYSLRVKKRSSQKLIPLIEKVLKKNNIKYSDLEEITVAPGPGSYTGIRVGLSVAQAIAWYQGIKVNGKTAGKEIVEIRYDE